LLFFQLGLVYIVRSLNKINSQNIVLRQMFSSWTGLPKRTPDSSPVAFKYKSGRAARNGRVQAHGKGERRKFSDWQITVIFLAKKCFSCKLIFYASSLDFLTLVYINRSFYDVVSAKCIFLSSISALNWSCLEYFKMADSDELRW
jgi:hypothetical protein